MSDPEPDRFYRGALIKHLGEFEGYRVTIPPRLTRDRQEKRFEVYSLPAAKSIIDEAFGR